MAVELSMSPSQGVYHYVSIQSGFLERLEPGP